MEPDDDNIFKWSVFMSNFAEETALASDSERYQKSNLFFVHIEYHRVRWSGCDGNEFFLTVSGKNSVKVEVLVWTPTDHANVHKRFVFCSFLKIIQSPPLL